MTVIVRSYVISKGGVIKKSTFSQAIKVNLDLSLSRYKKNFPGIKSSPKSAKYLHGAKKNSVSPIDEGVIVFAVSCGW